MERKNAVEAVAAPICLRGADVLHRDRVDRLQQSHAEAGDDHGEHHVHALGGFAHAREQDHAGGNQHGSGDRRELIASQARDSSGR